MAQNAASADSSLVAFAAAEQRFDRCVLVCALLSPCVGYWFHGLSGACAIAIGAAVGFINYHWLKSGVTAWLQMHAPVGSLGPPVRFGLLRWAMRLPLLAIVLCAIFISHLVPVAWAVAGLMALPAGLLAALVWEVAASLRSLRF